MSAKPKIVKFGEVEDETGSNRLSLLYENVVFNDEEGGYNFHSLVWDKKYGEVWERFLTITQERFEEGIERSRWIDKVDRILPDDGYAVISVGEGDAPRGSDKIHYHYSWYMWDLINNCPVALLKSCGLPGEPLNEQ